MTSRKLRPRPPAAADEDDRRLFREAVGPVRDLSVDEDLLRASLPPPLPLPKQSLADERKVVDELLLSDESLSGAASGEVLNHLQPGYPPKLLRQMRRGQFVINAEIDLHALSVARARPILVEFLTQCRNRRQRCVRVIHGKGLRSPDGSVIKALTERILRQRSEVIGFTSAPPAQGGTGAVLVLLKAPA